MTIAINMLEGLAPTSAQNAELGRLEGRAERADENYRVACPLLPAIGLLSSARVDRVNDVNASAKARLRQAERIKDEAHERLDAYRRKHFGQGEGPGHAQ